MGCGLVIISLFIIQSFMHFLGCWIVRSGTGAGAQDVRLWRVGGQARRQGCKRGISALYPSPTASAARVRHGTPGHSIPGALDIAACQFMLRGWWHGRRAAITDEQDNLLPGQLVQAGANVGAPAGADNLLGEGGTGLDGRGKGLPCG